MLSECFDAFSKEEMLKDEEMPVGCAVFYYLTPIFNH
ncbi:unnamed protein product [Soboliphyme baturini]|uniref:Uncharacterized protein n=1 Tax=Soboliphyme baturini TaxID=241478 RepID=A0A183IEB0_9BILA|nr:unnamed protein product [Soboliphyme baturini]